MGKAETLTWVSARIRVPEHGDVSETVVQFWLGSAVLPAAGYEKKDLALLPLLVPFHYIYSKFVLGFGVSRACDIAGGKGGR
mmetsp:Transcript_26643/g.92588  ORF Transcript_26643/g.92588 Transcript_26643/m.92588 type:complete len:82 (+) Transcript_26643:407-652(+)